MAYDSLIELGYTERIIRLKRKGRNRYAWVHEDDGTLYSPIFGSSFEAKRWMGEPGILKIERVS